MTYIYNLIYSKQHTIYTFSKFLGGVLNKDPVLLNFFSLEGEGIFAVGGGGFVLSIFLFF